MTFVGVFVVFFTFVVFIGFVFGETFFVWVGFDTTCFIIGSVFACLTVCSSLFGVIIGTELFQKLSIEGMFFTTVCVALSLLSLVSLGFQRKKITINDNKIQNTKIDKDNRSIGYD